MDITKTNKYQMILQREIDLFVIEKLTDEMMEDMDAGRRINTDAEDDARRTELVNEIKRKPNILKIFEDKARNAYYGKQANVSKSTKQSISEPVILEVQPKQGVFSVLRQMLNRAGRAVIPDMRRNQSKVYSSYTGV